MWLSLSLSFFFSFIIIIIIIFLCLFYSIIHTLYTIILEWSFHFSFWFACVCISRTVCVFKVKFELFPLVQFIFLFFLCISERARQRKHFNQQWHTHTGRRNLSFFLCMFVIYTYLVSVLYLRTARIIAAAL